ncbi:MAG: hypothetical protein AAF346_25140, partial [Pseudomonadota bacterium]
MCATAVILIDDEKLSAKAASSAIGIREDNKMAYRGLTAELIKIEGHNGDAISAYTVKPSGKGPFPGIVLIHHLPG